MGKAQEWGYIHTVLGSVRGLCGKMCKDGGKDVVLS